MWFERYGFKEDPYVIRDPFTIPLEMIRWDRDDLPQKENLRLFIADVVNGYRVGLKVYGPGGSGKTWLLRYLQKELIEKLGQEVVVIYGKIPELDPTFSALYEILVREWNEHRTKILDAIAKIAGDQESGWQKHLGDPDLGSCLWRMKYKADEKDTIRLCEHWLRGVRMTVKDLTAVGATTSLDRDYRKYFVLRQLLYLSLHAFRTCILIIDELENARPSLARGLGDSLRDLLDSFFERFALVCSYTAQRGDELLDWGYGEFLFTRLEWDVRLDPIKPGSAPDIFRIHHGAYRKGSYTGDQLFPFTEAGLRRLINRMNPERWYPRYIFINCGVLCRAAFEQKVDLIDEHFVDEQTSNTPQRFQYLSSSPKLI